MDIDTLMAPCPIFSVRDINTMAYWQEVKKSLLKNVGYRTLNDLAYHSMSRLYERNGGSKSTWPSPKYDATCLVLKKPKETFDHHGFFQMFPSSEGLINQIREKIGISFRSL